MSCDGKDNDCDGIVDNLDNKGPLLLNQVSINLVYFHLFRQEYVQAIDRVVGQVLDLFLIDLNRMPLG